MSYAEEMGYDAYDQDDIDEWRESLRIDVDKNGKETCANCGSDNIKISQKGNKYCGEICWVERPILVKPELPF